MEHVHRTCFTNSPFLPLPFSCFPGLLGGAPELSAVADNAAGQSKSLPRVCVVPHPHQPAAAWNASGRVNWELVCT